MGTKRRRSNYSSSTISDSEAEDQKTDGAGDAVMNMNVSFACPTDVEGMDFLAWRARDRRRRRRFVSVQAKGGNVVANVEQLAVL